MTPFRVTCPQMHVKDVQHCVLAEDDVSAQAAASFACTPRDVVILANLHRKAAQRHVSVRSAMQPSILSKAPLVTSQLAEDLSGLIELRPPILYIQNFLECHYIGVKISDHGCDSLRTSTPVEPFTFMDVVGRDANAGSHC
jgi:hypothetical protein